MLDILFAVWKSNMDVDDLDIYDALFRYNYKESDNFWRSAMKNDLEDMKRIYSNNPNGICVNIQQQIGDSYIQTALDWAVSQKNRPMIEWLLHLGAWTFKYKISEFKKVEECSGLYQKYDGLKIYHYWVAAEKDDLQDMKAKYDPNIMSPNLIRAGKTALDLAVINDNYEMAKYLIDNDARLCFIEPKNFRRKFPDLWTIVLKKLSPRMKLSIITQKLTNHQDLVSILNGLSSDNKTALINAIPSCDELNNKLEAQEMINNIQKEYDAKIRALEEENKQKVLATIEEHDDRLRESMSIKELNFMRKDVIDWTTKDVIEWVESICPNYVPVVFETECITGRVLLEDELLLKMNIPMGPRLLISKEIQKLKLPISNKIKYYAKSNYLSLINSAAVPQYQHEVFFHLKKFIEFYCESKGIDPVCGLKFFLETERETLENQYNKKNNSNNRDDLGASLCLRLWTSTKVLNKLELCSLLCEVIREDSYNAIKVALPLIKGISHISKGDIEWPKDNCLYRGAGISDINQGQFVKGKKYRCPSFLSASMCKKIGEMFYNRAIQRKIDPILFIFHLNGSADVRCCNVNVVMDKSNTPSEKEFLFLPYSVFTVRSIDWKYPPSCVNPHTVHLDVAIDSEQESQFLPLIMWH